LKVRLAGVIKESIVDGPGIRLVVFAQGCVHNCSGCQNPDTHPLDGGYESNTDNILAEIKKNPLLSGVTLSGGEPFLQPKPFALLAGQIKKLKLSVIAYSGFTIEQLLALSKKDKDIKTLLESIDTLVDGKFDPERLSPLLRFRGSDNQRIIDAPESVIQDKAVIREDF